MTTVHDALHRVADRLVAGTHPAPPDAVPGPHVERITTAEAARRLGISPSGVRRRIAAGTLTAEVEERPQGSRLVVLWSVPNVADAPEEANSHADVGQHDANQDANTRTSTDGQLVDKDALIRCLQDRLEQAEQAQAELRRMLNLEQPTVATLRLQLAVPRAPDAPVDANRTPTSTPTHTPAPRRPWWWRLIFRAE